MNLQQMDPQQRLAFRAHIRHQMVQRDLLQFCDDDTEAVHQLNGRYRKLHGMWLEHVQQLDKLRLVGVEASSTDHPQQGIHCTELSDGQFWSSTGDWSPEVREHLLYRTADLLCHLEFVGISIYRAEYQHGDPLYPPRAISILTGPSPEQLYPASPMYELRRSEELQVFPLYPWAAAGPYVKVVMYGKVQRQFEDQQFYIAIRHVCAFGTSLPGPALPQVLRSLHDRHLAYPCTQSAMGAANQGGVSESSEDMDDDHELHADNAHRSGPCMCDFQGVDHLRTLTRWYHADEFSQSSSPSAVDTVLELRPSLDGSSFAPSCGTSSYSDRSPAMDAKQQVLELLEELLSSSTRPTHPAAGIMQWTQRILGGGRPHAQKARAVEQIQHLLAEHPALVRDPEIKQLGRTWDIASQASPELQIKWPMASPSGPSSSASVLAKGRCSSRQGLGVKTWLDERPAEAPHWNSNLLRSGFATCLEFRGGTVLFEVCARTSISDTAAGPGTVIPGTSSQGHTEAVASVNTEHDSAPSANVVDSNQAATETAADAMSCDGDTHGGAGTDASHADTERHSEGAACWRVSHFDNEFWDTEE